MRRSLGTVCGRIPSIRSRVAAVVTTKFDAAARTDVDRNGLGVGVRPATDEDRLAVRRLLDAAVLAVENVDERLGAGDVLVATADGRVVGAAVLDPRPDGAHVEAIAVQCRRRGRGVGTALIERARSEYGPLTAAFDADVRPFYESLGFAIEPMAGEQERFEGKLE